MTFVFASCKKSETSGNYGDAPRTNPMPAELQGQWNVTTSGGGYVYDGWSYGNSGHGINVNIKKDGTGWWNDVKMLATSCGVLQQNLSLDNTFELKNENGVAVLYMYATGGTYHGQGCTTVTDIVLGKDKTYPALPPFKYYFKLGTVDNDPSQRVLVLSQLDDEGARFDRAQDSTMNVLKKQ